jgi:hypothetical protein
MSHTIAVRDGRCQLASQHNGCRLAEPAIILTRWQRLQVTRALHVASDAKITEAEACKVCPDWPDSLCASCSDLVGESIELIDLARQLMNGGAR